MFHRFFFWLLGIAIIFISQGCSPVKEESENKAVPDMSFNGSPHEVKLMTLAPGHFHAALIQKSTHPSIDSKVFIYAPDDSDVDDHLNRIKGFNERAENPTSWESVVFKGPDFFQKMLEEKPGNVMVTAGKNSQKTRFIRDAVLDGINVLADKPMAIDPEGFVVLKEAFEIAEDKNVLLYDVMTERFEITTVLQREFSQLPSIFGELVQGSEEEPAISKESVHHFFKYVAGNKIKRPDWFFDVSQQGEGIVDVTTHLVDLVQWECFPNQVLDYTRDVEILSAKRWPTLLSSDQFNAVTRLTEYPDFLKKDLNDEGKLEVYANGEINYKLKGIHAKVSVIWNYQAPEGAADTHYSIMRGTKANLIIRQGKEQGYKPKLYVVPVGAQGKEWEAALAAGIAQLQGKFSGIELQQQGREWEIIIPEKYRLGHEAHFGQVADRYFEYLVAGKLPEWEVPNMLAKYYTTTQALEIALSE